LFTDIREWYSDKANCLDSMEEEIKAIKIKITDEKKAIPDELKSFALTQEDIDFLYWETLVTKKDIAESVGKSIRDIKTTDKAIPIKCKCGIVIKNIYAVNKTEYESLKNQIDNKDTNLYRSKSNERIKINYTCCKCEGERYKITNYNLRHMPYKEYLKTQHWKDVREKALNRAGRKCQICNSDFQLNVHHRTYENRGAEKPNDVIALCRSCHEKFHNISRV
jgi:hypothetical protein